MLITSFTEIEPLKGFIASDVTLTKLFWSYMSIWTYIVLEQVLGTHSELKQILKSHFAQKLSPYN